MGKPDLVDVVDELLRGWDQREPLTARHPVSHRTVTRVRVTHVRSLLTQLEDLTATPTIDGANGGGSGFESTPPGNSPAVDLLDTIERDAVRELRALDDHKPRDTWALVAAVAYRAQTNPDLEQLVRVWHRLARIVTGWDLAPVTIRDARCPVCEQPKLMAAGDGTAAWCRGCRATWDDENVGVLGRYLESQTPKETRCG